MERIWIQEESQENVAVECLPSLCDTLGSIPSSTSWYKYMTQAQKEPSKGSEVQGCLQLFSMCEVSRGDMELCLRSDGCQNCILQRTKLNSMQLLWMGQNFMFSQMKNNPCLSHERLSSFSGLSKESAVPRAHISFERATLGLGNCTALLRFLLEADTPCVQMCPSPL